MMRTAIVVRPAPGGGQTIARLAALGIPALEFPLFVIAPVAWSPLNETFDALLVTSANAMRHGGIGLEALIALPVVAVGEGSARAARAAGFQVAVTGAADGREAVEGAHQVGFSRLLHLAGRDRIDLPDVTSITVYRSDALYPPPGALEVARGQVALLHSPRAARHFAALVDRDAVPRHKVRIAALSEAVAQSVGGGWGTIGVAPRPDDAVLTALAAKLAIDP